MFNFTMIAQLLSFLGVSKRRILFEYAKSQLGKEKRGLPDTAPKEVNCVEALNQIYTECFSFPICGGASTITLFMALKNAQRFKRLTFGEVLQGDIIVSPTEGNRHGHCGVMGANGRIMSNNSYSGLWEDVWADVRWQNYYEKKLGLKTYYFRIEE